MNFATGKVTDCGLAILNGKVEQLNRKAAKLKMVPITVNVLSVENVEAKHPSGLPYVYRLHTVEVVGEAPRINGWEVAARIEFTEAGNFVVTAPGVENLRPIWRTMGNVCEHCNTKRRRTNLIVIRHEDGREIVVGRNCLADYIRTGDAETLLAYASFIGTLSLEYSESEEGEYWGGGYAEPCDSLVNVLAFTSIVIRKMGWVSGKVADECQQASTAENVRELMTRPRHRDEVASWEKWIAKYNLYVTDFDKEEAARTMEFLKAIPVNTDNDYLHNLRIVGVLEYVPSSKFNLVVSAVSAAKRARDEVVRQAEYAKGNANKQHMGVVKERLRNLEVTIKRTHSFEGNFGVTTIITLACGDNELTWFASGDLTEQYIVGSSYTIDATVKEHKTDPKWGMSTVVNRVAESKPPKEKKARKAKKVA